LAQYVDTHEVLLRELCDERSDSLRCSYATVTVTITIPRPQCVSFRFLRRSTAAVDIRRDLTPDPDEILKKDTNVNVTIVINEATFPPGAKGSAAAQEEVHLIGFLFGLKLTP
jgi:hypothetical protein